MSPKCCIPTCSSKYGSRSLSLYRITSSRLVEWEQAVPFELKVGGYICSDHFKNEDIVTTREFRDQDNAIIGVAVYKRALLKPGAVPVSFILQETIEYCHSDLESGEIFVSEEQENPDLAFTVTELPETIKCSERLPDTIECNERLPETIECKERLPETIECNKRLSETIERSKRKPETIEYNKSSYRDTVKNLSSIHLPPSWKAIFIDDVLIFANFLLKKQSAGVNLTPYKEVHITRGSNAIYSVFGKNCLNSELNEKVCNREDLERIIKLFTELPVCEGTKLTDVYKHVKLTWKDNSEVWRHALCPLLLERGVTLCDFCQRVNRKIALQRRKKLQGYNNNKK